MVQLPSVGPGDSTSLGLPSAPNAVVDEARPDLGLILKPSEAVGQAAKVTAQVGSDMLDRQNQLGVAWANSHVMTSAMQAERLAELEPDPVKAKALYDNTVAKATQEGTAMIPGTFAQQDFQASVPKTTFWSDRNVNQLVINKQRDIGTAAFDQQGDDLISAYSQATDPAQRQQILTQWQKVAATAKNTGVIDEAKFYDANKNFSMKASQAYYELHPDELQTDLQKALGTAAPKASPQASNAVAAPDIKSAILNQESNNNPNAPTSVDGAVGAEQITPGTFNQYAKPGEEITNPKDRGAVFDRMMADYSNKFNGDPARIAVAYFSGPGNVAPAGSPTPWKRDVADGNGKTTSSYVSDITNRLTPGEYAGNDNIQSDAGTISSTAPWQKVGKPIDNLPPDQALQMAKEAEARGNILTTMKDKQMKVQQEQTMNDYLTKALQGKSTKDIVNDATLTFEQREKVLTAVQGVANRGDMTDPSVFSDTLHKIHQDPGTTGAITNPDDLIPLVGNGLKYDDMVKLRGEMSGRGQPDGDLRKQFFESAHSQISNSNMITKDPDGEKAYYNWYVNVNNLIAQKQKAGVPLTNLLDPKNKDYVGGTINQAIRTPTQQVNDMATRMRSAAPNPSTLPADQLRTPGESIDAYLKRTGQ